MRKLYQLKNCTICLMETDGKNIGATRALILYSILAVLVLGAMYSPNAALVAYIIILIVSYILKRMEGDFQWGTSLKSGFVFGLLLISIIFLIEIGFGWIKLEELYPNTLNILISFIIFEILVSAAEEMSFRGYILPNMLRSFNLPVAVVLTSLLFAGLHIPSILFLGMAPFNAVIMFTTITVAGILLALLYLKDGLKMCGGFHFSWNFFQYHVFSLRSGFGIFGLSAAKPELTGGMAGPEAGIMGLFILLIGILIVLWIGEPLRKE